MKVLKYILISLLIGSCTKPIIQNPNYYLLVNKSFTSTKIELSQDNTNWVDETLYFYPTVLSFNNLSNIFNGGTYYQVSHDTTGIIEHSGYWNVSNSKLTLDNTDYNILFLLNGQLLSTSVNKLQTPNGEYWYWRFTFK